LVKFCSLCASIVHKCFVTGEIRGFSRKKVLLAKA
jgi:hypothetical protein